MNFIFGLNRKPKCFSYDITEAYVFSTKKTLTINNWSEKGNLLSFQPISINQKSCIFCATCKHSLKFYYMYYQSKILIFSWNYN